MADPLDTSWLSLDTADRPLVHPDETVEQFRARIAEKFPASHRCDLTCPDYREHMRAAGIDPDDL